MRAAGIDFRRRRPSSLSSAALSASLSPWQRATLSNKHRGLLPAEARHCQDIAAAFSTTRTSDPRLFEAGGEGDERRGRNCQGGMCCAPIDGSLGGKRSVGREEEGLCGAKIEASLRALLKRLTAEASHGERAKSSVPRGREKRLHARDLYTSQKTSTAIVKIG